MFFVRTNPAQGDSVWVYQTDTLAHSNSLGIYKSVFATSNYIAPPQLPQKNSTQLLLAGTARVLDGFLLDNKIHFVYPKRLAPNSSQISYNRLELFTGVLDEKIYNNSQYGCTYPSLASFSLTSNDPSVVIGFSSVGTNSYVSYRAIGCNHLMDWSNELTIIEGDTIHVWNRWGDYTGAVRERETLEEICWVFGNYTTYDTLSTTTAHKSYVSEIRRAVPNVIYPGFPNRYKTNFYPNPTSNLLNIEFENIPKSEVKISVLDVTGKEVSNIWGGKIVNNRIQVDFPKLSAGMYFMRITENNQIVSYEKIIVN